MNRSGKLGDEISVVYFIFLFLIIGLGLAWGCYSYFGGGYDVRGLQAKWLENDIQNCLISKNVNLASDDFFKICNLNNRTLTDNGFIVRVCESDCYNDRNNVLFSINSNYQLCGFNKVTSITSPRCSENTFELNGRRVHLIVGSKVNPRRLD